MPLVVVGFTSSFPLMAAATFVIGVTDGAGLVIWGTLLQRRVPTEMLGRVSSLDFFVSLAFMPVSFADRRPAVESRFGARRFSWWRASRRCCWRRSPSSAARMRQDELAHPLR